MNDDTRLDRLATRRRRQYPDGEGRASGCEGRSIQRDQFKTVAITIHLPGALRGCCEGATKLEATAPTVRAALEHIERTFPSLHRCICDETGAVRRHINIWINATHMREREGLDTPLAAGDAVSILPAVSGG